MSTVVLPRADYPVSNGASRVAITGGIVLALWLVFVFVAGSRGAFAQPAGTPPLPIFFAVTLPIAIFLAAYRTSSAFRYAVLHLDQRLAVGLHAWRFGGLGFLALSSYSLLPGVFAWPAGLGDMAIGATAPVLALAIARNPHIVTSRLFVVWNLLGILDLVVAIGAGTLVSWFEIGASNAGMGPMARLPLLLIPAFLVPSFVMLHIAALLQARHRSAIRSRFPESSLSTREAQSAPAAAAALGSAR
jgi:hypothetical protein